MASFSLKAVDRFPVGTSVGAYPQSNWLQSQLPPSGAPQGAATESAVVSAAGVASFSALADETRYYAYALVDGQHRYVSFSTPAVAGVAKTSVETVATGEGKALKFASISAATSGDNTVVAAVTGSRIKVVSYVLVAAGLVTVKWKSGAATDLSGAMSLAANGGVAIPGQPSSHIAQTAAGQALVLNLSAAVQVSGHVAYFEEA